LGCIDRGRVAGAPCRHSSTARLTTRSGHPRREVRRTPRSEASCTGSGRGSPASRASCRRQDLRAQASRQERAGIVRTSSGSVAGVARPSSLAHATRSFDGTRLDGTAIWSAEPQPARTSMSTATTKPVSDHRFISRRYDTNPGLGTGTGTGTESYAAGVCMSVHLSVHYHT
jgi:hypothetical protein